MQEFERTQDDEAAGEYDPNAPVGLSWNTAAFHDVAEHSRQGRPRCERCRDRPASLEVLDGFTDHPGAAPCDCGWGPVLAIVAPRITKRQSASEVESARRVKAIKALSDEQFDAVWEARRELAEQRQAARTAETDAQKLHRLLKNKYGGRRIDQLEDHEFTRLFDRDMK